MPEPKKGKRNFESNLNGQVSGLRLVRQQRPSHPHAAETKPDALSGADPAGEIHPPEPELVSKLIDYIKKI